ncbi:MAG: cztR [Acidobacteriales bacterium]|nr:cztR [Terriglobales bacterium]
MGRFSKSSCASRKLSNAHMKILLVEDETKMAQLISRALKEDIHSVAVAHTGPEGLDLINSETFDLIILDVMLPGITGFEVATRARKRGTKTPILMLTARDAVPDIVAGLDAGADDYLTKPFSLAEFLARVRAIARRGPLSHAAQLKFNDLVLDPATHEVNRGGRRIDLTKKEYMLLEVLLRQAGRVVQRDHIIDAVWSNEESVENNTLDAFISSLRNKVDGRSATKLIRTIRGVGYRIG